MNHFHIVLLQYIQKYFRNNVVLKDVLPKTFCNILSAIYFNGEFNNVIAIVDCTSKYLLTCLLDLSCVAKLYGRHLATGCDRKLLNNVSSNAIFIMHLML